VKALNDAATKGETNMKSGSRTLRPSALALASKRHLATFEANWNQLRGRFKTPHLLLLLALKLFLSFYTAQAL
jgi:hypothetical protein